MRHARGLQTMSRLALIVLGFGVLSWSNPSACSAQEIASELVDIDGKIHKPFEDESTRGLVLVFVSTDCPVANSYQPLLHRLADKYRQDGIRFFMIHPDPKITADDARHHAREFKIHSPVVIDEGQQISRRVGATITPQAFVFVRDQNHSIYHGRIDNRYAGYGKKRNAATTHDLADALDAVVAGVLPKTPKTNPVGCHISYAD